MMTMAPSPARNQQHLRQQIAELERLQEIRIDMVATRKKQLDDTVTNAANIIANLKAQQTLRGI